MSSRDCVFTTHASLYRNSLASKLRVKLGFGAYLQQAIGKITSGGTLPAISDFYLYNTYIEVEILVTYQPVIRSG